MKQEAEIWKDIAGYEGLYQVSNIGRVRSLNYRRTKGLVHILRPGRHLNGYLYVNLGRHIDGKWEGRNHRIHRLVAEAFIPNPENKREVDHCDGNINNNSAVNLRWATPTENMRNPITLSKRIGRHLPEETRRKIADAHRGKRRLTN